MPRTTPTEVGLGALAAQTMHGTAPEVSEAFAQLVEACVAAEEHGLDSVWTSEHHFAADGYLPSPLVVLAALSRETERVRLATNILIGPLHEPIRLAEDAAVIDHLSGGRLMLGIGLGYRDVEFAGLGRQRRERGRRVDDLLAVLAQAWAGHPIDHHGLGDHVSAPVTPPPLQPGGPPVLVGAFGDAGLRRAARADGWITPELAHPQALVKRLPLLDLDRERDRPFHVAVTVSAFVAASDAWETVRPGVEHVNRQYHDWLVESGDHATLQGREYGADADASGKPPTFMAGRPDEVAAQLRPWWQVLESLPESVTPHLTIRTVYPGVSRAATVESVRLLATEVLPLLRSG